ncbi:hypothetical protein ORI89_02755 [Sphingobacterium sp. UT-1RO-CII-1]|uniref:hypothetical protein n=1 Tax=Sphingobacterium sp. UT-1RO-CII-1 TaxID=2995225 RepID=UPI00227BEE4C|nr:hypothetical protein [Sphingobacterium sp. UT-1RO-CII-1]MCY4778555.1 hypothetical protein [Sphingobacterium sp. UT-1RO-CII-1]
MNKIIRKMREAVQVVLLAPIKLPVKIIQAARYVALALGVLEAVTDNTTKGKEQGDEHE